MTHRMQEILCFGDTTPFGDDGTTGFRGPFAAPRVADPRSTVL